MCLYTTRQARGQAKESSHEVVKPATTATRGPSGGGTGGVPGGGWTMTRLGNDICRDCDKEIGQCHEGCSRNNAGCPILLTDRAHDTYRAIFGSADVPLCEACSSNRADTINETLPRMLIARGQKVSR